MTNIFDDLNEKIDEISDSDLVVINQDNVLKKISANKVGNQVSVTRILNTGTRIAEISINGVVTSLFCSSGGKIQSVEVDTTQFIYDGTLKSPTPKTITIEGQGTLDWNTVKDNFTLSGQSSEEGQHELVITGNEIYSGEITVSYNIYRVIWLENDKIFALENGHLLHCKRN